MHGQTKDLFQLQTELVDMKVDMAVSKAIDRIVDQITSLKNDMHSQIHDLRNDMNSQFSALDKRVFALEHRFIAVENKLGITNETRRQIKNRFIDYSFKAGWVMLGIISSALAYIGYLVIQLHALIR